MSCVAWLGKPSSTCLPGWHLLIMGIPVHRVLRDSIHLGGHVTLWMIFCEKSCLLPQMACVASASAPEKFCCTISEYFIAWIGVAQCVMVIPHWPQWVGNINKLRRNVFSLWQETILDKSCIFNACYLARLASMLQNQPKVYCFCFCMSSLTLSWSSLSLFMNDSNVPGLWEI